MGTRPYHTVRLGCIPRCVAVGGGMKTTATTSAGVRRSKVDDGVIGCARRDEAVWTQSADACGVHNPCVGPFAGRRRGEEDSLVIVLNCPTFPSERFRTARKARGLCAHVPPLLHAWRRASVSAGRTRVSTSGLAQLARGARTRKRHAIRRMVPEPGSKHFLSLQGGRQVAEKRLRSTVFFTVACRV